MTLLKYVRSFYVNPIEFYDENNKLIVPITKKNTIIHFYMFDPEVEIKTIIIKNIYDNTHLEHKNWILLNTSTSETGIRIDVNNDEFIDNIWKKEI